MKEETDRPIMKLILEFGPIIIFFLAYYKAPIPIEIMNDREQIDLAKIIFATKVFIPTILISLLLTWMLTKKLAQMPVLTAVLVLFFGGLTIWLRDPVFIKMKPTVIYVLFSAILAFGIIRDQSYLKALMGKALPITHLGWIKLTKRFCIFFMSLAILNEIIWRNFSQDFWVNFKTFGLPGLLIVFFIFQVGLLKKYSSETGDK